MAHTMPRRQVSIQATEMTMPHVVIVGAGFGGLAVAQHLKRFPVRVTVVDRQNFHLFQPMLYQVATAGLASTDITAPVRSILHHQVHTEVFLSEVVNVDLVQQQVITSQGPPIPFDYLVLATGAKSNYFGHDEWEQIAPSMKSIHDALRVRNMLLLSFEEAERDPNETQKYQKLLTFVLVGGGPTGVELAGSIAELTRKTLQDDFRHIDPTMTRIVLVQGPERILPEFPEKLARKAARRLRKLGVEIRTGRHVTDVMPNGVMIDDEFLPSNNVIWTAGVKASHAGQWLKTAVDHNGRVKVLSDLSLLDHPNIFVIGDTAAFEQGGQQLPGVAQVAIQSGHHVAKTIAYRMHQRPDPGPFHYTDKGSMAIVGRGYAIVASGLLQISGFLGWLMWIGLHIFYLIDFKNRVITLIQYAWNYLTYQRGARVIETKEPYATKKLE